MRISKAIGRLSNVLGFSFGAISPNWEKLVFWFCKAAICFFAAKVQAVQGSPSDKDIIDLYGHYGLEATAVNAAMRPRICRKNAPAARSFVSRVYKPVSGWRNDCFLRYICYPTSCWAEQGFPCRSKGLSQVMRFCKLRQFFYLSSRDEPAWLTYEGSRGVKPRTFRA